MKRLLYFLLLLHAIVGSTVLTAENSSASQSWFNKLSLKFAKSPTDIPSLVPIDINRDGRTEFLIVEPTVGLHLYRHNPNDFLGKIPAKHLTAHTIVSRESTEPPELIITLEDSLSLSLVSVQFSGNANLSDYEVVFDTVYTEKISDAECQSVGKPSIVASLDANSDGIRDYIAFRAYGPSEKCRSVTLLDGATNSAVWSRYFGPLPQSIRVANLDGIGAQEIVVSACAVNNGRATEGYSDSLSYLFAFSIDGKDFWPPLLVGGDHSRPKYDLIPAASGPDTNIVVTEYSLKNSQAPKLLRIISGSTGAVLCQYEEPGGFKELRVACLDSSAGPSILAVSNSGSIMVFDDSLWLLQSRKYSESVENIFAPVDCDGDGAVEFPIVTADNMFWIIDRGLSPMIQRQLGSRANGLQPIAVSTPGEREFIVAADRPYIMTFFWGGKSFAEIVPPVVQMGIVLSSLAALLIGYLQIRHRRRYFEFLDSVFNDSSRAIIALSANRTFTRTNAMADELFDAKRLLLGRRIDSLAEHHSLAPLSPILMPFLETGGHRLETGVKLLIGNKTREFTVSICRGADAKSGREHVTIIMLQDITELSQAKMYTAWSQVASGLAHDLRKPLAPLKLLLQDLLARTRTHEMAVDTVDKDYLAPAMVQVERMAKYIDQLATVASSKDARREEICVSQWLQCLLNEVNSVNGSHPAVALNMEPDLPSLRGNRDDLERVLLELIDNAVTATQNRPESAITVRARLSDQTQGHLRLEVADNGCGIAPEFLSQVFEPYVTTGSSGHRGLGLWTARKIVTEHGGSIEIQSTAGIGTVFVIELPGVVKGA